MDAYLFQYVDCFHDEGGIGRLIKPRQVDLQVLSVSDVEHSGPQYGMLGQHIFVGNDRQRRGQFSGAPLDHFGCLPVDASADDWP